MNISKLFFDTNDYEKVNKEIGKGTYGQIFIIRNKNDEKELYAIKSMNTSLDDINSQMLFLRESLILSTLNHAAIIKFRGINFQPNINSSILSPIIVTDYLPNGSLDQIIKNEINSSDIPNDEWNSTKKHIFLLGIADAMRYLHQHNIIHRDLKPANILIDNNFYPCVCDFGQSIIFPQIYTESIELSKSGDFGTPLYNAPELLDDENSYGPSIDVYSYAIIAYEIISKQIPFNEIKKRNYFSICDKVVNGKRPTFNDNFTEKMKNLISRCWDQNPRNRPAFDEIFDLLSTDFTYLNEEVDEDEIKKYITYLKNESSSTDDFNYNVLHNYESNDSFYSNQKENLYSDIIKALVPNTKKIDEISMSGVF